jgi:integrase
MSEPFEFRGGWYLFYRDATGKRKRKKLADTKREAYRIWKQGLANGTQSTTDATFAKVADEWLDAQERRLAAGLVSAKWLQRADRTVQSFLAANPRIRCSQITERIAVDWLPENRTQAYERTEAQILKQILAWAVGKHISSSPLAAMKLEKGARRERLVTIDEHRRIVAAAKPNLRALLWMLWWTGARPGELRALKWEHVKGSTAVLREHKTARKGKGRTLYFPFNAQTILSSHKKTSGHVFTNNRGQPWTMRALCRRIEQVAARAGILDVTAYDYRHTFITRAMLQGLHAAVVAEMTGTSVEMIARHYGHLEQAQSHIVEAARGMRS